jgi:polyisoprenoid-binding protein YceI
MLQTLGRPRQRPAPGAYRLDRSRCLAQFSVRHFMVSTVRGTLQPIEGSLVLAGDDLVDSSVRVDLDASSLDTGLDRRDAVLTGPQFLDTALYPVVRFESRQLVGTDPARFDIVGDLYLGVRATPICLSARVVAVRDKAVSFAATGVVRRTDVDLAWRRALEGFGLVVGDTVRLTIGAEFVA